MNRNVYSATPELPTNMAKIQLVMLIQLWAEIDFKVLLKARKFIFIFYKQSLVDTVMFYNNKNTRKLGRPWAFSWNK